MGFIVNGNLSDHKPTNASNDDFSRSKQQFFKYEKFVTKKTYQIPIQIENLINLAYNQLNKCT